MRTRIKVCCVASLEEAQLAIQAGADAVGLIGTGAMPSSSRAIDDDTVAAIAVRVPPPIATFLLTSEATAAGIASRVLAAGASAVQIVPHISPGESEQLASVLPVTRRVQVIHVENESALDLFPRYAPHVHAFLLDSGRPGSAVPEYGGTGRTHDWFVSAEFVRRSPRPVFLAGGLSPANVREAVRMVRPFGVDVCSGVRTHGRLDRDKLNAFIHAVRETGAGS
jgi:phosphoribosylanthranilate isomerase